MAVTIKTPEEIKIIVEGGKRLGEVLERLGSGVAAGRVDTTGEIDQLAEKWIKGVGGRPAFKGYGSPDHLFPGTICVSINDEVVHGIPSHEHPLRAGDIIGLDIGMVFPAAGRGFYTDTAITVAVGSAKREAEELMMHTYESLRQAIAVVRAGAFVADIGASVQGYLRPFAYGIIRDFVGHGVGYKVHEEPKIPNFVDHRLEPVELKAGMVLALEPMVTLGGHNVYVADNGWTVKTKDGSLAAHFEHTIVVTPEGAIVATKRPGEEF